MTGKKLALFGAIVLLSTSPIAAQQTDGTTLQEYAKMDNDAQFRVIFDTKHRVIEEIRYDDPERALCIAGLFGVSQEGDREFGLMKDVLKQAAERQMAYSAEEITEIYIKRQLCPAESSSTN